MEFSSRVEEKVIEEPDERDGEREAGIESEQPLVQPETSIKTTSATETREVKKEQRGELAPAQPAASKIKRGGLKKDTNTNKSTRAKSTLLPSRPKTGVKWSAKLDTSVDAKIDISTSDKASTFEDEQSDRVGCS